MNLTRLWSRETEPLYKIVNAGRDGILDRGLEYAEAVAVLNRRLVDNPDERNTIVPEKLVCESWWKLSSETGSEELYTFAQDFDIESWVDYLNAKCGPRSGGRWRVEEVAIRDAFALGLRTPKDGFDLYEEFSDNEEDMLNVYRSALSEVELLTLPALFEVNFQDLEQAVERALRIGASFLDAGIVEDDMRAHVEAILEQAGCWRLDGDTLVPVMAAAA